MSTHFSTTKEIEDILSSNKTIAIVGLSPKKDRASNRVARYLQRKGYQIIPVNPMHDKILGLKSYSNLKCKNGLKLISINVILRNVIQKRVSA